MSKKDLKKKMYLGRIKLAIVCGFYVALALNYFIDTSILIAITILPIIFMIFKQDDVQIELDEARHE